MLEAILGLTIMGLGLYLKGKDDNGNFSCETLSNDLEKDCINRAHKISDAQLISLYDSADNSKAKEIYGNEMRRRHLL
ncbi:MAG: hypothetical protein IJA36_10280 [Lachnospiraceae bacterium]|nr:hypothetical protein [Lachnospiraceae bacterium]